MESNYFNKGGNLNDVPQEAFDRYVEKWLIEDMEEEAAPMFQSYTNLQDHSVQSIHEGASENHSPREPISIPYWKGRFPLLSKFARWIYTSFKKRLSGRESFLRKIK